MAGHIAMTKQFPLRSACNDEEIWAHSILDMVKAGLVVSDSDVRRALWVLGDLVGLAA